MGSVARALTRPELIFPDLPAADRAGVLRALAERVAARRGWSAAPRSCSRGSGSASSSARPAIGPGVAIPHCKLPGCGTAVVAVGLVPAGVEFGAVDGQPVKVFFLVVSPGESPAEHLRSLAAISRWIKADGERRPAPRPARSGAVYDLLCGTRTADG